MHLGVPANRRRDRLSQRLQHFSRMKGAMCHCRGSRNPDAFCHPNPPHPAWPSARPASPTRGEAGWFILLKCYEFYFLDSRLRGNDTLGLACRGRGGLLHSAKALHFLNRSKSFPAGPDDA